MANLQKLIIYHGSSEIVEQPIFGKGKPYNDYGRGFYCTEHKELAKEWACTEGIDGYANRYEIDVSTLSVLNLSSPKYNILNWLAILMENRKVRLTSAIANQGREYLLKHFLPEYKGYDAIIGYRADDSYFSFARSFVTNQISLRQLGNAMRLGKLGEQFVLKSKRAFETIKFLDYTTADTSVYYPQKMARDEDARLAYEKEISNMDLHGIFMRDILVEEMKNDDPRLQ